jgi:hypothetical protein
VEEWVAVVEVVGVGRPSGERNEEEEAAPVEGGRGLMLVIWSAGFRLGVCLFMRRSRRSGGKCVVVTLEM